MVLIYMTLFSYINSLSESELKDYADRCGTSAAYMEGHIKHARRVPRPCLMEKLHTQSRCRVTKKEVIEHFYNSERAEPAV